MSQKLAGKIAVITGGSSGSDLRRRCDSSMKARTYSSRDAGKANSIQR